MLANRAKLVLRDGVFYLRLFNGDDWVNGYGDVTFFKVVDDRIVFNWADSGTDVCSSWGLGLGFRGVDFDGDYLLEWVNPQFVESGAVKPKRWGLIFRALFLVLCFGLLFGCCWFGLVPVWSWLVGVVLCFSGYIGYLFGSLINEVFDE